MYLASERRRSQRRDERVEVRHVVDHKKGNSIASGSSTIQTEAEP